MDLSQYLQNGADAPAEAGQQLSKEEYAAMKKQEREEVWAEVDAKAQEVFRDGESLKGFLNFWPSASPRRRPTSCSCTARTRRSGRGM